MAEEREVQSHLTQSFQLMPAIVVESKDPDKLKRGRVKVRTFGGKNQSDEKLGWGYPISQNIGTGGVGHTSHPYKPGQWVICGTNSTDGQTYVVFGAIHSAGMEEGGGNGSQGGGEDRYYEPPYSGKPEQQGGGGGQNFHKARLDSFEVGSPGKKYGTGPNAGGYDSNPKVKWKYDKDMIQWAWKGVPEIIARSVKADTIAPKGDDEGKGKDVLELVTTSMARLSANLMKNTAKDPTKNLDALKG